MERMPQITRDPNHSIQHVKTINGSNKNTVQAPLMAKLRVKRIRRTKSIGPPLCRWSDHLTPMCSVRKS